MNCANCKKNEASFYSGQVDKKLPDLCEDCYMDLCAMQEYEREGYEQMEQHAQWDAEMRAELYKEK